MSFVSLLRGVSDRSHRVRPIVALAALVVPITVTVGGVAAGNGGVEGFRHGPCVGSPFRGRAGRLDRWVDS